MVFVKRILSLALLATSFQGQVLGQTYSQDDIISGKALQQMSKTAYDTALKRLEGTNSTCTTDTLLTQEVHTGPRANCFRQGG